MFKSFKELKVKNEAKITDYISEEKFKELLNNREAMSTQNLLAVKIMDDMEVRLKWDQLGYVNYKITKNDDGKYELTPVHPKTTDKLDLPTIILTEGKVVELPDEKEVLEVSTEPVDTKIEKDDKNTFEEFKVLYKGQIDDKCLEDYGTIEDKKLWEDTAKELFMASEDYIPDENDKAEKIEESKPYIRRKDGSEEWTKSELKDKYNDWREDNNWSKEEYSFNDYLRDIDESGEWELVESVLDRYQVREFDGPGAKFGVYDTKEKKFVQKGSKYIMNAACKDLNEKGKVTESSIIKSTLKEMMNKKQESTDFKFYEFDITIESNNNFNTIKNIIDETIDDVDGTLLKISDPEIKHNEQFTITLQIKIPSNVTKNSLNKEIEKNLSTKIDFIEISEYREIQPQTNLNESIEDGASIFELKFDCSNEDTFGIGQEMINPIADTLREVIEKIEIGRFDGPIMDVNGNKIGSFGIGYQGVQSGLSESKKVEESVREDLIQLRKDNKGLYDYVANNYYNMSTEELKEIALNAIYVADNDAKIIDEYTERMDESVNNDIEKAKIDSKEKGLYSEGVISYTYTVYTKKDKNDVWDYYDVFDKEEDAKNKVDELKSSKEYYDAKYKPWKKDYDVKKDTYNLKQYDTVEKIKARIKEINNELAYCRRRDRVCATFGGEQQVFDLNSERDLLRKKLQTIKTLKKEAIEDVPNITWILENYDWDVDIMTEEQLGSDYLYRKLCRNVDEAARFNYHSDYWGDADSYQDANIELMEQIEPYVGKEVIVDFDDGSQKYKILGIAIDKQYNSLSHTCILAEELGEPKTESIEKEVNVTDANEDINSVMVTYISNQTFMKYYNLDRPLTEKELDVLKLKIKNKEMYITDFKDKLNATEVNSRKELIPNTYVMKIKENDIEDLEESKQDKCVICGSDNLNGCFVLKSKNICKECGKKYSLEEIEDKLKTKDIKTESQVSDYTFKELNKVINDKGNDFKIQISGSEDKTNWLNIDKEDLQAIYQALQNKKAK